MSKKLQAVPTKMILVVVAVVGTGAAAVVLLSGSPSRADRTDVILGTMSDEDLIVRRAQLQQAIERVRDQDARLRRGAEESLKRIVNELDRRGIPRDTAPGAAAAG